jgi:hypothetical protein
VSVPSSAEDVVKEWVSQRINGYGGTGDKDEDALQALEDLELACLRMRRRWAKRSPKAKELMST